MLINNDRINTLENFNLNLSPSVITVVWLDW
jgi:hypothetical protein